MSDHTLHGCTLLERIGEGGIADVFRAEWNGKEVALKVLRDVDRGSMKKRFLREGRLLQRLDHPSLVRCLHVFDGESPALVLELLRGSPLDQRIARQPLDADDALHLATATLRVLQYLHEHGIVHRDVKASNIFCANDNRTVLMDLGLAADPTDPLTTTLGDVLGTYAYMAPEQIAGAESDHRCDLYSLGVTLYEAICGARPYAARGPAGWLAAHRGGTATPLVEVASGLPVRLAGLIDRLMARDPLARPATAAVALSMLTGVWGVRRELHPAPLVGRDGIRGAVEAALDGGGPLVVTGIEGSGLGRLVGLAQGLAAERQMETIALRTRGRTTAGTLVARLGSALERFGLPRADDEGSVRRQLGELAAEAPLLLLVEDAEALAPAALELLFSVAATRGLTTIVLGVDLESPPGVRRAVLRALVLAEVRALVAGMLDSAGVPPGLDLAVLDASGGLPGNAVVLVREQAEAGTLWCEGLGESGRPAWRWDAAAGLVLGDGSRRGLTRSMRRLSTASRRILELLAVAEDQLPVDLVLDALGEDLSGVDLGGLVRLGLVEVWSDREEEWVALRRAVFQRLFLDGLEGGARVALHRSLAEAVARRPRGEWEQRFGLLHAALATPDESGAVQLLELGEHLASWGRPTRALQALEHLSRFSSLTAGLTARRAFARALALRGVDRLLEARDALAAAAAFSREGAIALDTDPLELEIALTMGVAPSPALVERVWNRSGSGEAGVLLASGELAAMRGQMELAERLLSAAVAASPSPIDRVATHARIATARSMLTRGAAPEAESRLLGLIRELRGRDLPRAMSQAYVSLGLVQRVRGQLSRALDSARMAAESADHREGGSHRAAVDVVMASASAAAGDLVAAEAALGRVEGAGQGLPYEVRAVYFEVLGDVRRLRGDGPAALAVHLTGLDAARAAEDVVRIHFHEGMAGLRTANARVLADAVGRLDELGAHRHLAQLFLLGAVIGRDPDILGAAEARSRRSGDPLLLLDVLHAGRSESRRTEARAVARGILESLSGSIRDAFRQLPQARWSLGEPDRAAQDTEA